MGEIFGYIAENCFTNGEAIVYKGVHYYKSCAALVTESSRSNSYCVKRLGHPSRIHEDYEGRTFNELRVTSTLIAHAKYELDLLDQGEKTIEAYLKVIEAFVSMGLNGGSTSVALPLLVSLLQYKPVSVLTDNPDEWLHVPTEFSGVEGGVWQNIRDTQAFSSDGGKTYYHLSEGADFKNQNPVHITAPYRKRRGL